MAMGLMMLMLTACGGSGEADPNLGLYVAKTASMSGFTLSVEEMYEDGFTIELKKRGKLRVEADGEGGSMKWTLDGDHFHAEGGGAIFDGTLKDGVMVLENLQDSGMDLTLVCDEAAAAAENATGSAASDTGKTKATLAGKRDVDGRDGEEDPSVSGTTDEEYEEEVLGSGDDEAVPEDNDEPGKASMNDRIGGMLDDGAGEGAEEVGNWELFTLTQNGKSYMEDDLKAKGVESSIQINADGTGQIFLVGSLMDMTWGNGQIIVPENDIGERDEYRYSMNGGFLVLVDEDMTLAFRKAE